MPQGPLERQGESRTGFAVMTATRPADIIPTAGTQSMDTIEPADFKAGPMQPPPQVGESIFQDTATEAKSVIPKQAFITFYGDSANGVNTVSNLPTATNTMSGGIFPWDDMDPDS